MTQEFKLSDTQLEDIVARATERVIERLAANMGRGILSKAGWITSVLVMSAMLFLAKHYFGAD